MKRYRYEQKKKREVERNLEQNESQVENQFVEDLENHDPKYKQCLDKYADADLLRIQDKYID